MLTPLEPWIAHKIACEPDRPTPDRIEAYQLDRLNKTLALCRAHSTFYRTHLAGLPTQIDRLDDVRMLPFTTAQDLRRAPLGFVCVSQSDVQRVVTLQSSGTTAQPKRLFFSKEDQELTIDFFRVGMSTFTRQGDRALILLPAERAGSVGDLLAEGLKHLGAHAVRHGPVHDVAETLAALHHEQVNVVVGVPVQVLSLVRAPAALDFPQPRIDAVLLSTDHVPDAVVQAVRSAWKCEVYNHYGMTEMGLGGGVECDAHADYHLREADLLVEIIDPASGQPAADGEQGEIVVTTLTRHAMPLIRYRTGDLSRFIPEPCACGTVLRTLARVRERIDSFVTVGAEDRLSMADLDEILFGVEGVLDFEAGVALRKQQATLRIEIQAAGDENTVRESARAALDALPVVRGGQVALELTTTPRNLTLARGAGKRLIRRVAF
jgi:phenylacetate-coenzyme A ligase PaaK-like adenylate-forming protein